MIFRKNEAILASSLYIGSLDSCSWFSSNYPFFDQLNILKWPLWDLGYGLLRLKTRLSSHRERTSLHADAESMPNLPNRQLLYKGRVFNQSSKINTIAITLKDTVIHGKTYSFSFPSPLYRNDSKNNGYENVYDTKYHVETTAEIIDTTPNEVIFFFFLFMCCLFLCYCLLFSQVMAWPGLMFIITLNGWDEFRNPTTVGARFTFKPNRNNVGHIHNACSIVP